MPATRRFNIVNVHAAGEVCDVIVGGVLDVPGKTMYDKMTHLRDHDDSLRHLLLNEPRGRAAKCQNLILPPCHPEASAGLIIMEHEEYPAMSGANTIATATVLLETGMIRMVEPSTAFKLDTPAGLVKVIAECENGRCKSISFENVPAFVFALDQEIRLPDLGIVKVDIAWGGMFYALIDAASVNQKIERANGISLVKLGERIKTAVQQQTNPVHPQNPEIRGVTVLQFTEPLSERQGGGKIAKNTVVVSPGRLDRSPCGTGSCARLAVLHARGELRENELLYHRSIIDTEFVAKIPQTTKVADYPAVVPVIKGRAWITGYTDVVLDPTDPFPHGFRVGDSWHFNESVKSRL